MIKNLNVFSENTFLVAEEWNANFKVLMQNNKDCAAAINDAQEQLAFPDSDLSGLKSVFQTSPDCSPIVGTSKVIEPQYEYYKSDLTGDQTLSLIIGDAFRNTEARVVFRLKSSASLRPFEISGYSGTMSIDYGRPESILNYDAGMYFLFLKESNGTLLGKLVATKGV